MICISIAQESRTLALVDMHNAAPQCDLLELRLDKFERSPDLKELMGKKPKPVIVSCRRQKDGGEWTGSESERLTLLRQAIVDGADYVEIELDVADQIRPFPGCKRVVSVNTVQKPEANFEDLYDFARARHADVFKIITLARTPEEAWPLIRLQARAALPTVVVGLGKPGVMFSILGQKLNASWTYAALERGMEAYPGQVTVRDLREIYHYPSITPHTKLLGVTGFGHDSIARVATLNAALAHLELPLRCLPMGVGSAELFKKVCDAVKVMAVVVDPDHRHTLVELARNRDKLGDTGVDLLVAQPDHSWAGKDTLVEASATALDLVLKSRTPSHQPLQGRMVLFIGARGLAGALGKKIIDHGGVVIFASRDKEAAQKLAHDLKCRYVPFEAIYATTHEVLVIAHKESLPGTEELKSIKHDEGTVHPGILKPSSVVMDLTSVPEPSPFLMEAVQRGCAAVDTRKLFLHQIESQLRLLTHKTVPPEVLFAALEHVPAPGE